MASRISRCENGLASTIWAPKALAILRTHLEGSLFGIKREQFELPGNFGHLIRKRAQRFLFPSAMRPSRL